jgi:lipopolysaccharide/colanic/teichoic acid biosynthesis glycosyltransferase
MLAEGNTSVNERITRADGGRRRAPAVGALPGTTWYARLKGAVDFVLALVLFIVLAPVMLLTIALVRLTSRGPAIYRQKRLGLHGRIYTIYKIRTMTYNCESRSGPQWCKAGDPRVTPVGRFLRKTHLDELPQLWNVLRGDMSLVGPRPERPEFLPVLEQSIAHYRERLQVRPGVTGLAQVQLPPDTDVGSVRRKLACDLYYVYRLGFWLDVRLLFATAFKVLGLPFGLTRKLLRVPSGRDVELLYKSLDHKVEKDEEVPELEPALQNA